MGTVKKEKFVHQSLVEKKYVHMCKPESTEATDTAQEGDSDTVDTEKTFRSSPQALVGKKKMNMEVSDEKVVVQDLAVKKEATKNSPLEDDADETTNMEGSRDLKKVNQIENTDGNNLQSGGIKNVLSETGLDDVTNQLLVGRIRHVLSERGLDVTEVLEDEKSSILKLETLPS